MHNCYAHALEVSDKNSYIFIGVPPFQSMAPQNLFEQVKLWAVEYDLYVNPNQWGYPWNVLFALREVVFIVFITGWVGATLRHIYGYGIITSLQLLWKRVSKAVFTIFLLLPPIKKQVDKEVGSSISKVQSMLIKNNDDLLQFAQLPDTGLPTPEIDAELDKLQELEHSDWVGGHVSGAVYHGGDELIKLQSDAYHKFAVANQLHPDVFPGVRKMESEVVSMVLDIFNGPEGSCGATSSGGTESLLLAGLSAREYGRRYKGITKPEVIAPVTVHAGIEKACTYFGMTLHKVDLDPVTYKVDISKVRRLINGNTVLLVGSAPNFPHGIIDDIPALSKLAVKYNIPLHVDACLGSFIVSFLEKSKVHGKKDIPGFDFRVPGVTLISCDTHKYGFAPKGSLIIMYRNAKLRECQYYVSADWTGGLYGSPTLAGSRPGALMVGCWATLVNIGKDGYTELCKQIVSAAMDFKSSLQKAPLSNYLKVIGDPIGSVVAFEAKDNTPFNIYELSDVLSAKGWHYLALQRPAALHFAFTKLSVPIVGKMVKDLEESVEELVEKAKNNPDRKVDSDVAAFYGIAGSVKTTGIADRVIVGFLDGLYKRE